MEGMRGMALAHFENLPYEVKAEIHNDFKREVGNGSISEYFKRVSLSAGHVSVEAEFHKTCEGIQEGRLDFNDFITLKYTIENVIVPRCNGCSSLIMGGPFFSCWDCFFDSSFNDSCDLCSSCYRSKKLENHHHKNFINNQTMQYRAMMDLAKERRNRDERDEFIKFASTLMQMSRSVKTDGWMDYRDELAKISLFLKEHVEISDAKQNAINSTEEENKATETGGLHLPVDLLGAEESCYTRSKRVM